MSIEAMRQALEALDEASNVLTSDMFARAAAALRTAIKEAEKQEPVAWMCSDESLLSKGYLSFSRDRRDAWNIPVFTAPQPRQWQGLTKNEVNEWELPDHPTVFEFAKFVEAKLKEKSA